MALGKRTAAGVPFRDFNFAQYVFDHTFEDQNFNGLLVMEYDQGRIELEFDNGKNTKNSVVIDDRVKLIPTPIFMSKTMRTFDQMNQYLKLSEKMSTEDEILEFYKLYDVVYMQAIKIKLAKEFLIPGLIRESFAEMQFKDVIVSLFIKDNHIYYKNEKGEEKNTSTLSAGEQSMLNMMIAHA
jgi:hypothetical protein